MHLKDSQTILKYCDDHQMDLFGFALEYEASVSELPREELIRNMRDYLQVMKESVACGFDHETGGRGKIIERKAYQVHDHALDDRFTPASGQTMLKAVSYGLAVMEVNVTMGRIVAAPTAGASGIIPGVFLSLQENFGLTDDRLVEGLFVASLVGALIARNASISGARVAVSGSWKWCGYGCSCRTVYAWHGILKNFSWSCHCPQEPDGIGLRSCSRSG